MEFSGFSFYSVRLFVCVRGEFFWSCTHSIPEQTSRWNPMWWFCCWQRSCFLVYFLFFSFFFRFFSIFFFQLSLKTTTLTNHIYVHGMNSDRHTGLMAIATQRQHTHVFRVSSSMRRTYEIEKLLVEILSSWWELCCCCILFLFALFLPTTLSVVMLFSFLFPLPAPVRLYRAEPTHTHTQRQRMSSRVSESAAGRQQTKRSRRRC